MTLWALEWRQKGEARHIIYDLGFPKLFRKRSDARIWANERFGYIKTREDLRRWPHFWRFPATIKVKVEKIIK